MKIFPMAQQLEKYAWPGGYPLMYLVTNDYGVGTLCPKCAQEELNQATINGDKIKADYFIHYEGPPEICEGCNEETESAYGDPDADSDT